MIMIIVLLSLLGGAFGNPDTHVYSEECAPPEPGFGGNATTPSPGYVTLKPIERCCPQCDQCKEVGGFCALKWAVELYPSCCDFAPVEECRDYSCKCCIKCSDDECSPCVQTGGNCRKECRAEELEDEINLCSYNNNGTGAGTGCKCCKKCEAQSECTDAEGICVTDPANCLHGTFASTGCCGGCYCCKPVLQPVIGSVCEQTNGICSETGEDCPAGYYGCFGECSKTTFAAGLQSVELGYCCIPKQTASQGTGRIDQLALMMNQAQQQHGRRNHPKQLFN